MENQDIKILWAFKIRPDGVIEARRSHIVLIDKNNRRAIIIWEFLC